MQRHRLRWLDATRGLLAIALLWALGSAGALAQSQSLFTTQTPVLANASDGVPYELGMKFRVSTSGRITAIRYWKSSSDTGTHTGRIWSSTGTQLTSIAFSGGTASGWQSATLTTPLAIQANTTYVVSVNINSNYPFTNSGLATSIVNGNISSVADGATACSARAAHFRAARSRTATISVTSSSFPIRRRASSR